jgi:catechol 2,3-dioxygenase-like lactoylglutathione lyase family enzyme
MKRFHVHLRVQDLDQSIGFYSRLFAAEPTRHETDYAKWMLEDPPVNFAISTRGGAVGIDHLGIQAGSAEELATLKARARSADEAAAPTLEDEGATTCCYARSEKHWVTDPQGVAWEHFQTLADIPVFHERPEADHGPVSRVEVKLGGEAKATCGAPPARPAPGGKPLAVPVNASSCC